MAKDIAPSMQFYMRDWMTDSAVQGMTWDQRGRYHWALCLSALSPDPGKASEKQWRLWMHYSEKQWALVRERMAEAFKVHPDGTWIQKRMAEQRTEQRDRFEASGRGGAKRAANMTPEQRSAAAQVAAFAKHEKLRSENADTTHVLRTPASASALPPENQKPPASVVDYSYVPQAMTPPRNSATRPPAGPEPIGAILSRVKVGQRTNP